jgi:hypothetical protein
MRMLIRRWMVGVGFTATLGACSIDAVTFRPGDEDCMAAGVENGNGLSGCADPACEPCSAPQTCGGGGIPNQCGCTPMACLDLGATCGPIGDGCGGMLDCGACSTSQTCGGGGVPNQCGCTPPDPITVRYADTSLTACPGGQQLGYFIHSPLPDESETRADTWCGAAAKDVEWANANDPVTSRLPYLLETCTAGVSWSYSHAFPDGSRYHSPLARDIDLICTYVPPCFASSRP